MLFRSSIRKHFQNKVLEEWLKIPCSNKLRKISADLDTSFWSLIKKRRDQVIYCRLRIGHSLFTHGHLLKKSEPRVCSVCGCIITVEHILLSCPVFAPQRASVGLSSSIDEIFCTNQTNILRLLRYIDILDLYKLL